MADLEHIGWFICVLVPAIIVLITFMMKYITKPMVDLERALTRLYDRMENFLERENGQDKRLDEHDTKIDNLNSRMVKSEVEIENLKKKG